MTTTTPMPVPSTELLRLSCQTSARLLLDLEATMRRGTLPLSAGDLGARLLLIRCVLDGMLHGDPLPETINLANVVRGSLLLATISTSPVIPPAPATPDREPATPLP